MYYITLLQNFGVVFNLIKFSNMYQKWYKYDVISYLFAFFDVFGHLRN